MRKPSGFTLRLDGEPDEVARILAAFSREWYEIAKAKQRRDAPLHAHIAYPTSSFPETSLRGTVSFRYTDPDPLLLKEASDG